MKDIKDYLHLYFGCEAVTDSGLRGRIVKLIADYWLCVIEFNDQGQTVSKPYAECKLVLRPLSSMTEEEFYECKTMVAKLHNTTGFVSKILLGDGFKNVAPQKMYKEDFHVTAWLLSKHFDLFGLIESNLAVASNK